MLPVMPSQTSSDTKFLILSSICCDSELAWNFSYTIDNRFEYYSNEVIGMGAEQESLERHTYLSKLVVVVTNGREADQESWLDVNLIGSGRLQVQAQLF